MAAAVASSSASAPQASGSVVAASGPRVSPLSPVLLSTQREAGVGVNLSLHPLPILTISEHLTRSRMQAQATNVKVFGALLGTQNGRDVEIQNTFEMRVTEAPDGGALVVDHAFFTSRQAQFKQVFPTFEFLGWYAVGAVPQREDLDIHRQLLEYNEAPIFLQLSPSPSMARPTADSASTSSSKAKSSDRSELPLSIYESVVEITPSGTAEMFFTEASYRVETGEAERIAVDFVSKPSGTATESAGAESSVIPNLVTQHNAISMLHERIRLLLAYVTSVAKGGGGGGAARDHEALRQIKGLLAALPAMGPEIREFKQELMTEYNDVTLTNLLSGLTQGTSYLNDLVDKFDVQSTAGLGGSGGGGGGGGGGGYGGSGGGGGPFGGRGEGGGSAADFADAGFGGYGVGGRMKSRGFRH